jgi:hypothetical protein
VSMDSRENEGPEKIQGIAVSVDGVPYRIFLSGHESLLPAAFAAVRQLATAAVTREEFFDRLAATVEVQKAALAEIRGGTPTPRTARVIDLLRATAKTAPTAEVAWLRIEALLTGAGLEDLESLVDSPDNLQFSRQYLEVILDDLDEHRDEAEKKLRSILREPYSSLLIPPSEWPRR